MHNLSSKLCLSFALILIFSCDKSGLTAKPADNNPNEITLPAPDKEGGKPLMKALSERRSHRAFSSKELPLQTLSNLLWAGFGINESGGRRTAPSAANSQEIDIYLAMKDGVYVYVPASHSLKLIIKNDIRAKIGKQDFVKDAPVVLIYVADTSKMGNRMPPERKTFYSATDTGFISQNVYLCCASERLSTVVLGSFDAGEIKKDLSLKEEQNAMLIQPVGYKKE